MILDCIIQQAAIEEHLADEIYASETRSGRFPKRRSQGRLATISSPAPPVCVRPEGAEAPQAVGGPDDLAPDDDFDDDDDDDDDNDDDDDDDGADASFRAQQAATLDPILNQTEADRRFSMDSS